MRELSNLSPIPVPDYVTVLLNNNDNNTGNNDANISNELTVNYVNDGDNHASSPINTANEFDPLSPNDPSTIEEGMIVAVAFDEEDYDKEVYYGRVLKKPSQTKVRVDYYVQNEKGILTMPSKPERDNVPLKYIIYVDIKLDEQCIVQDIAEVKRRYKIYHDEWFID